MAVAMAWNVAAQEVVTYKYKNHEGETSSVEAVLRKPAGTANQKAIVILHHAGGWADGTTQQYAELFAANGYVTLEPRMFNMRRRWEALLIWPSKQTFGRTKFQSWACRLAAGLLFTPPQIGPVKNSQMDD